MVTSVHITALTNCQEKEMYLRRKLRIRKHSPISLCSSSPICSVFEPFSLHLMCLGSSGSGLSTGKLTYFSHQGKYKITAGMINILKES